MTIFCIESGLPLFSWISKACVEDRIFVLKNLPAFPDFPPQSVLLVDGTFPADALNSFISKVRDGNLELHLICQDSSQAASFFEKGFEEGLHTVSSEEFRKDPHPLAWIRQQKNRQGGASNVSSFSSQFQGQDLQWTLLKSIVDSLASKPLEIPALFPWISVYLGVENLAYYESKNQGFERVSLLGSDETRLPMRIPGNDPLLKALKDEGFYLSRSVSPGHSAVPDSLEFFLSHLRMKGVLSLEEELSKTRSLLFFSGKISGLPFSPFELQNVKKLSEWLRKSATLPPVSAPMPDATSDWSHLKNFATRTATEFKNTLVSIKTFTQLFPEKYKEPHFRKDFYKVMSTEVSRLEHMMDTLAFFASESHHDKAPKDLRQILQAAYEAAQTAYPGLVLEGLDALADSLILTCDEKLLTKAFAELLLNAATSMQGKGTVTCSVSLSSASGENRLPQTLSVCLRDQGSGIAESNLPRIFNPFFSTKANGLGLGLTFAKGVIEAHGGTLEIKNLPPSQGGAGTQVSVSLPASTPRFSKLSAFSGPIAVTSTEEGN